MHRRRKGGPRGESTERAVFRRFWLDRFNREEIVDMAHAIFPRGTERGLPNALTAAANDARRDPRGR